MNGTKKPLSKNAKQTTVSIITPSYNQATYIEQNIESVLAQDYPHIEHIIIDGASTDSTLEILKKYNGRVRWISERDSSPEEAINKGLHMACGSILAVLNSDDYYLPGALSKAVGFLEAHSDVSMVYCKAVYVDDIGKVLAQYPTEPFDYERLAVLDYICHPSVFFTREVLEQTNGYSELIEYATDFELWLRIAQQFKIQYLPEITSAYRIHKEARNVIEQNAREIADEVLDIVISYFHRAPINRVFACAYYRVLARERAGALRSRKLRLLKAVILALKDYLRLNKTIHKEDLKLLTPANIKKMLYGWEIKDFIEK